MLSRPEWLLPAIIAALVSLTGTLVNHALRCIGAATVTVLLALAARLLLIRLFDSPIMSADGWLLMLAPAVALDVWYGLRAGTGRVWLGAGVASALGTLIVTYPLAQILYPIFSVQNIPVMIVVVLLAGIGAAWVGAALGDYLATANKFVESAPGRLPVRLVSMGGLLASLVLIVVLVVTAAPPV